MNKQIYYTLVLLFTALPITSYATLGGDVNSVKLDNQLLTKTNIMNSNVLQGDSRVTVYDINNKKTQIKEYVSNNKVFAVSWSGASYPNFKQIMNDYRLQFKTGTVVPNGIHAVSVYGNDFIFQQSGYAGDISGIAYIPSFIPLGLNINIIFGK